VTTIEKREFYHEYNRALREDAAALFVGAGISVGAGFVDWKSLLREVAEDLGLDVAREQDLIGLAQFHVNHRQGRDRINQLLIDHFIEDVALTENHRLIASLPIRSIWTTNYDDLIEKGLEQAGKRADIKRRESDFATTRRNSDAVVYKMHGDKTDPAEAILTKEDYETYHKNRELFTTALKGDLVTKTFLFIGVSFSDPNIGYILGRVKQLLEGNSRQHYCLIKRPKSGECGDDDYSCNRFEHWLADLRRYKIIPVIIDSYSDVTSILSELNRRSHLRDIFLSGSADEFSPYGRDRFEVLCQLLGRELISKDFNIISAYGAGVGGMVIVGAMQSLPRNDDERLRLWPFPQEVPKDLDRATVWRQYRERLLSNAGICIVLSGNKFNGSTIQPADGVREEVEIARARGIILVPIGATGHVAREVWDELSGNLTGYYGTAAISESFTLLGDTTASPESIVRATIDVLKKLDR